MKNLSIFHKVLIVFGIVVLLASFSFLHLINKTYEKALITQGRNIAQLVITFRKWIANYGTVWTKDKYEEDKGYLLALEGKNGTLKSYGTNELLGTIPAFHFYAHNPALATRELSGLTSSDYGWSFRAVSDRYLSPTDKPDKWEMKAISKIKEEFKKGSKTGEFWGWDGNKFRFAKALKVKKGCLKCHGTDDQIDPKFKKAIIAKYGEEAFRRATGYKLGELRGIISVTIIPPSILAVAVSIVDIWNVLALLVAFGIFWYFAKNEIVKPIEKLTKAAHDISLGKLDVDLGVRGLKEENVRDEITKFAIAIDRLRASIQIAMERLRKKR
jgi:HAMP domain-containing protein/type II secretory pathway pseudopilin PulG